MKLYTKEMQNKASNKMLDIARDIDLCLYNVLTDYMPNEIMIDALALYLTDDGGFGNGLYIDNYNPHASAYEIFEAFRYLDMAGVNSNIEHDMYDQLINKACNFLFNKSEIVDNKWNPNVESNENYAHSIYFEYNEENRNYFGYGPTAGLLGYILKYVKPTKAYYKKALKMVDAMLKDFFNLEALTKPEFIGFNIFLNSIKEMNLYTEYQEKLEERLTALAKKQVSVDFSNPKDIHPLDCALYLNDEELKSKIDLELDYIIDNIAQHGLWEAPEGWGYNKYPEEDTAMIKWIGAISAKYYFYLKKFGRIE